MAAFSKIARVGQSNDLTTANSSSDHLDLQTLTSGNAGAGTGTIMADVPATAPLESPLSPPDSVQPGHWTLMTLPREVRDEIYRHLLPYDQIVDIRVASRTLPAEKRTSLTTIMRACCQLYLETSDFVYQKLIVQANVRTESDKLGLNDIICTCRNTGDRHSKLTHFPFDKIKELRIGIFASRNEAEYENRVYEQLDRLCTFTRGYRIKSLHINFWDDGFFDIENLPYYSRRTLLPIQRPSPKSDLSTAYIVPHQQLNPIHISQASTVINGMSVFSFWDDPQRRPLFFWVTASSYKRRECHQQKSLQRKSSEIRENPRHCNFLWSAICENCYVLMLEPVKDLWARADRTGLGLTPRQLKATSSLRMCYILDCLAQGLEPLAHTPY